MLGLCEAIGSGLNLGLLGLGVCLGLQASAWTWAWGCVRLLELEEEVCLYALPVFHWSISPLRTASHGAILSISVAAGGGLGPQCAERPAAHHCGGAQHSTGEQQVPLGLRQGLKVV